MFKQKQSPTRWYYLAAFLLPIFACIGTMFFVKQTLPNLPGALDAVGIQNLTPVLVPGSKDINFPKAGAYAVYYEYHSIFNGVIYSKNQYPPDLICQLNAKTTGESIELTRNYYIEGNVYTTQNGERSGVHFLSITIEKPGLYTFACQYPNGNTQPKIVLAVGPNIVWEFLNIAVRPIASVFSGMLMFICACGVSILIVAFVAVKRHRSKMTVDSKSVSKVEDQ